MNNSFGIIGLGVMGKSLAKNILDKDHSLSVYNRNVPEEDHLVDDLINSTNHPVDGFTDLQAFVHSLAQPRKILLMIKAGSAVDQVLTALAPFLHRGDVVIDGGNSYYKDSIRRFEELERHAVHFIGCGISGGEEGALKGPSIMPGGSPEGYKKISKILESIAAKDKRGKPCCTFIGTEGSGHFVKMIHNGIEYAEMQLIAEMYHLLSASHFNEEIAHLFEDWNRGDLSSYLLEITIDILRKKEGDEYLLDNVLDKAENKGTGSWSSQTAMDLGFPATMITDSVFARYLSSFKSFRESLSARNKNSFRLPLSSLKRAYRFGKWINHIQGMMIIQEASEVNQWSINMSELARIWTNGCIIRSKLMEGLVRTLKKGDLLKNEKVISSTKKLEPATKAILKQGIQAEIPLPALSSGFQFWLGITTGRLPANLIQAQRDYFGAHTYQRVDKSEDEYFHTDWRA